jgi:Flp pilus assembly protein TadB
MKLPAISLSLGEFRGPPAKKVHRALAGVGRAPLMWRGWDRCYFWLSAFLAVFALFLLLGAVLISSGVIGVLTIGAILSAVWRGRSRRIG